MSGRGGRARGGAAAAATATRTGGLLPRAAMTPPERPTITAIVMAMATLRPSGRQDHSTLRNRPAAAKRPAAARLARAIAGNAFARTRAIAGNACVRACATARLVDVRVAVAAAASARFVDVRVVVAAAATVRRSAASLSGRGGSGGNRSSNRAGSGGGSGTSGGADAKNPCSTSSHARSSGRSGTALLNLPPDVSASRARLRRNSVDALAHYRMSGTSSPGITRAPLRE